MLHAKRASFFWISGYYQDYHYEKTILGWVQSEAGLGRRVGVRAKASECVHFIMPTRPRARHGRGAPCGSCARLVTPG